MKKSIIIICLLGVILMSAVGTLKWRQISDVTTTLTEINYIHGITGKPLTRSSADSIYNQIINNVDPHDSVWYKDETYHKDTIDLMLDNAIKKSGIMRRVCQNNTQVSHTGDIVETTVLTMTIPANSIGANGSFHILPLYSVTGAGSKIFRIKFNGTSIGTAIITTTSVSAQFYYVIRGRNSNSSQVSMTGTTTSGGQFSPTTASVGSRTFDVTQEITVTVTVELATTTDQGNVEGIEIYASY